MSHAPSKYRFHYIHCSGRFDKPAKLVREDVARWDRDKDVSLHTFTEFDNPRRRNALQAPGWAIWPSIDGDSAIQRVEHECVVRWKIDTWEILRSDFHQISNLPSFRSNGKSIPPLYSIAVLLRHKPSGNMLIVSVMHMPSHVEHGAKMYDNLRAKKWRQSVPHWRNHITRLKKAWHADGVILVADWNVDLKQRWFRKYLHKTFPSFQIMWGRLPAVGTLGRRIIDVPLYSRKMRREAGPFTLYTKSSDHRAFKVELFWKVK